METITIQQPGMVENTIRYHTSPEELKSFNPLASVDRFRFDLDHFGFVLPETRQRVREEELSYLAEGIDRAFRTTFVLQRRNGKLTYFDEGQWRPYQSLLTSGLVTARHEAIADPRRAFLAEMAAEDLRRGYHMEGLRPGEQAVWASPYRRDIEARYGQDFMRSCGFQPERALGFLYRASGQQDGSIILESQTLDLSDEAAFAAALRTADRRPGCSLDVLMEAYDEELERNNGGRFYAGRRGARRNENAWREIARHEDLTGYFLQRLEGIAGLRLPRGQLERIAKEHVYGVWAAFKKRLETRPQSQAMDYSATSIVMQAQLSREVERAFRDFAAKGVVLVGCGGVIEAREGSQDLASQSMEDVFSSIFNGAEEDKYGSLSFKCSKGHANRRPRGRLIERCQVCGISVRC